VQGVIILRAPLQSTAADDGVVRSLILGGNPVFLTVSHEFMPAASDVKGYVYGGRAQQWPGDQERLIKKWWGAISACNTAMVFMLKANLRSRAAPALASQPQLMVA
jgi:hypothetical protein